MKQNTVVTVGLLALVFAACTNTPRDPRSDDTPTYGHVSILADESFRSILEDEEGVYEYFYKEATVDITYLPEGELLKAMLHDSVRAVFASFLPGGEQEAFWRPKHLIPHVEAVATDGIALIVSKASKHDSLTVPELIMLLQGLSPLSGTFSIPSDLQLVFDRSGSGIARELVDSLLGGDPALLKAKISAAGGIEDLVTRVSGQPDAIGFLPFCAISDLDNAKCRALRDQVKLLMIGSGTSRCVLPSQSTLADKSYPLRRNINMIVTEGKSGLGTGFASFVAGPKGQKIILKRGLVPAHIPTRNVEVVFE
ncbi:MAG: substrate-binding domain-containing protein [Flavobacteriales bacterium]